MDHKIYYTIVQATVLLSLVTLGFTMSVFVIGIIFYQFEDRRRLYNFRNRKTKHIFFGIVFIYEQLMYTVTEVPTMPRFLTLVLSTYV